MPSEYVPPEYKPPIKCFRTSISPGLIFGILRYVEKHVSYHGVNLLNKLVSLYQKHIFYLLVYLVSCVQRTCQVWLHCVTEKIEIHDWWVWLFSFLPLKPYTGHARWLHCVQKKIWNARSMGTIVFYVFWQLKPNLTSVLLLHV